MTTDTHGLTDSAAGDPVLSVRDLTVSFPSEAGIVRAVRGVDFDLYPGRTLALVGESGSGKSVTSLAIMGLLPDYAKLTGSITYAGTELIGMSDKHMCDIRGAGIAMVFQDPLTALTPVFTVGNQIIEAIRQHQHVAHKTARAQAIELLELVGIPEPAKRVDSFPHEFSGGMRQRVVIAVAIANNPRVLIADEPTTALDVTVQAQILDVLRIAQRETGAATIMITHDMGVVADTADDVMVMYAGRPVERADVHELFADPKMPYTIGLLGSTPRVDRPSTQPLTPIVGTPPSLIDLPTACAFAPRCPVSIPACLDNEPALLDIKQSTPGHRASCVRSAEITDFTINGTELFTAPPASTDILASVPREQRDSILEVNHLHKSFPLTKGALVKRRVGTVQAVEDLSFDLRAGECLAIVGESGSGKTTTLLEILNLDPPQDTTITLCGQDVEQLTPRQRRAARTDIQIVFQDPISSLDPRQTVNEIITEPLRSLGYTGDIDERVTELMGLVGLDPVHAERFPGQFSGGQRQRIGLARALATNPKIIVLDEPVSALDVSIQAGIINLLVDLKRRLGLSLLFIAHDLSVIRHLSDRVAVMYQGQFVEQGPTDEIFTHPQHAYTQKLLAAIPIPDPNVQRHRSSSVSAVVKQT